MGVGADDVRAGETHRISPGVPGETLKPVSRTLRRAGAREEERMRVLYNSELSFNRRIYGALDVALSPIHLSRPLEDLMKLPVLYTRGPIPHACSQALTRFPEQLPKRELSL